MKNVQDALKVIIASLVGSALIQPFLPQSSGVLMSGVMIGVMIYASLMLINYAVGRSISLDTNKLIAFLLAGVLNAMFVLDFIQPLIPAEFNVVALGLGFYISLVIVNYVLRVVGFAPRKIAPALLIALFFMAPWLWHIPEPIPIPLPWLVA